MCGAKLWNGDECGGQAVSRHDPETTKPFKNMVFTRYREVEGL